MILVDDLDQGWLRARAHLMAVYVAAGRGEWDRAADHADTAASHLVAAPGAGSLELANARTAIAVASDDPAAVVAAVGELGDLGRLARLEPTRLMFWPAYAYALARLGRRTKPTRCCGRSRNSPSSGPGVRQWLPRAGPEVSWKPPGTGRTPHVRRSRAASRTWRGWSCPSRRRRRGSNTAGSSGTSAQRRRAVRELSAARSRSPLLAHSHSGTAATASSARTCGHCRWPPSRR